MTSHDTTETSTVEPQEEKLLKVRVIVHTSSREEFRLDLGQMKESEREKITGMINGGFVMGPSKDWILGASDGREYHFNIDHVVLVVVELS